MSVTPVMPVSTFLKRAWPSLTTKTPCHSSLSLFSGVAATVAALAVLSPLDARSAASISALRRMVRAWLGEGSTLARVAVVMRDVVERGGPPVARRLRGARPARRYGRCAPAAQGSAVERPV